MSESRNADQRTLVGVAALVERFGLPHQIDVDRLVRITHLPHVAELAGVFAAQAEREVADQVNSSGPRAPSVASELMAVVVRAADLAYVVRFAAQHAGDDASTQVWALLVAVLTVVVAEHSRDESNLLLQVGDVAILVGGL